MRYLTLKSPAVSCFIGLWLCLSAPELLAAEWSNTEAQLQYGNLDNPYTGSATDTTILTFQHASGWQYGDNFFFVDFLNDGRDDGFNEKDVYAEWYSNFSLGKISGCDLGIGPFADFGLLFGYNFAADANVGKVLPGVRLSWDIPLEGAFLNTDITGFFDDSRGNIAPKEGDSFMIDFNGAFPFTIMGQDFSIEGHIEYIGDRSSETGARVNSWILAQPQFRWDMGKALFDSPKQLFLGIEYQYWRNKQGTDVDESAVQALLVWRF